ncbi:DUF397 domain-containing protein [Streptomyces sp. NPDC058195]|uniref:DUF397 domain-containing protein n=1 Tax=Streptomyces sp. NPDC058195 TaxID=3346375 RepID=UPI0036E8660C
MSSTPDSRPTRWVTSTYSGGEGQCVEWAPDHAHATGVFLIRDSKIPHGPHLTLTHEGFTSLVALAKHHG